MATGRRRGQPRGDTDPVEPQHQAILDSGCGYLLLRDTALIDTECDAVDPPVRFIAGVGDSRLTVKSEVILFAIVTDAVGREFYLRSKALLVPELASPILLPEAPFLQGCPECSCNARCNTDDPSTIIKTLQVISASGILIDVKFKTNGKAVYPTQLKAIDPQQNFDDVHNIFYARPKRPQLEPVETANALAITDYSTTDFDAHVGHLILGHQSPNNIAEAIKNGQLIPRKSNPVKSTIGEALQRMPCEACLRAKSAMAPRPKHRRARAVRPYEVLHLDVIYLPNDDKSKNDPNKTSGKATLAKGVFDNFLPSAKDRVTRYLLLAVCEATKMAHVHPMPDRKADIIARSFRYIENDIRHLMIHTCQVNPEGARERGYSLDRCRNFRKSLVTRVHGDLEMRTAFGRRPMDPAIGGDFYRDPAYQAQLIHGIWTPILESRGVYDTGGAPILTTADALEPWNNGLAERRHHIIDGNAQASLLTAKLGIAGYHYAYINAAYNLNLGTTRIPVYDPNAAQTDTPTYRRSTPLFEATGMTPDLNKLPVHAFGATCFPHVKTVERARAHQPARSVGIFLHPRAYPHRDMIICEVTKHGRNLQIVGPTTVVNDRGLLADSVKSRLDVLGAEIYSSSRGAQGHMVNFEKPAGSQHQSADELFKWLEAELPAADRELNKAWGRTPAHWEDDWHAQQAGPATDAPSSRGGDAASTPAHWESDWHAQQAGPTTDAPSSRGGDAASDDGTWERGPVQSPQGDDPTADAPPSGGGDTTAGADQRDDGNANGEDSDKQGVDNRAAGLIQTPNEPQPSHSDSQTCDGHGACNKHTHPDPTSDTPKGELTPNVDNDPPNRNLRSAAATNQKANPRQSEANPRQSEANPRLTRNPLSTRKSARIRDRAGVNAVGDAHHADTVSATENELQYKKIEATTAIELHLLELTNNDYETIGPQDWLEAYVVLADMRSEREDDADDAYAYAIRAATDACARRTADEVTDEEWNMARLKELASLSSRNVFELATNIPAGTRIIDVREIRSVRPDGSVKIRLVARGFKQEHGHNFTQTHSAVASPSSIMTLFGIAAARGWYTYTADCASAYLQSLMDEDVFCRLPSEWDTLANKDGDPKGTGSGSRIYRLVKSIYGLKQSGRNWAKHLNKHFQNVGLTQCDTDRSVHYLLDENGKLKLMLATVVDDIIATGERETFDDIIAKLTEAGIDFDEPSIGVAKSFNGMRIEQPEPHLIKLDQEQYINELHKTYHESYPDWNHSEKATLPTTARYEMDFIDATATPRKKDAANDAILSQSPRKRAAFLKRYQHLLGALLWPSRITRPDLAYVTGIAGQCAHQPRTSHLLALEHLLSYAVNTKDKKIVIDCRANPKRTSLSLFTDADHAACHDTRKSRSGVVVFMNNAPISWQSKKQTLLTNSTMAAETVAAYTGLQKLREPMELLRECGFIIDKPPLFCDNSAVLQHALDDAPQPGMGTKHLELYTKILREACVRFGDFHPFYVNTTENPADIFTKANPSGKDSEERWNTQESRIRGEPADPAWILRLIKAKRDKENNRSSMAMEITSRVRSPNDYLTETGWEEPGNAFTVSGTDSHVFEGFRVPRPPAQDDDETIFGWKIVDGKLKQTY